MPRLRSFVEMVAAVMLVVGLAFACAAKEVIGPPGPPPNQQPVPGAAFPSVAAPPNGGLPSAAAPWPELSPAESPPGPDSWQRSNRDSAPPGDVMGLGDFGGRGGMMEGFGGGMFRCDSIRYTTTWFPNVPVQGQAAQFQMVGQDLSFTHPLWSDPINTVEPDRRRPQPARRDRRHPAGHGPALSGQPLGRAAGAHVRPATQQRLGGGRRPEHRIGQRPSLRRDPARCTSA